MEAEEGEMKSCVLLTVDNDLGGLAYDHAQELYEVMRWDRSLRKETRLDTEFLVWLKKQERIDYLFNFLSAPKIPKDILKRFQMCINFHPAPPKYPGVGGASYALYNGDKEYGVTAHVMNEDYDAGAILKVNRFGIQDTDTCETLHDRALKASLILFREVLSAVPCFSTETWARRAYSKEEFKEFMEIDLYQDGPAEVERKIKALRHSRYPGPFISFSGHTWRLES